MDIRGNYHTSLDEMSQYWLKESEYLIDDFSYRTKGTDKIKLTMRDDESLKYKTEKTTSSNN